eukprot:2217478-Amphidinium_carterae.1
MQHFGAYIVDMLYAIYAAEVGIVRETISYKACSNWCSGLWEKPEGWSHVTREDALFNINETWVWPAIMLGKLRKVSHMV